MKSLLARHWFMLGLLSSVMVGFAAGQPLQPLAEHAGIRTAIVLVVMFLMALPLPAGQLIATLKRPGPAFLATLLNSGLMPLLAWPVMWLFPVETGQGILVAALAPCTLASAAVWTRRGGGNDATAILVTILSNGICFVVIPLWLLAILGQSGLAFEPWDMAKRLALLVLLPLTLAQIFRRNGRVAQLATQHKSSLSTIAQLGILLMVMLGCAKLSLQLEDPWSAQLVRLFGLVPAVVGLHVVVLVVGWWLAGRLKMPRSERVAVAIAGSQKTLMVGLSIAIDLGVSILPMVVFHVGQLIVDTLVVDRWAKAEQTDQPVESSASGE